LGFFNEEASHSSAQASVKAKVHPGENKEKLPLKLQPQHSEPQPLNTYNDQSPSPSLGSQKRPFILKNETNANFEISGVLRSSDQAPCPPKENRIEMASV